MANTIYNSRLVLASWMGFTAKDLAEDAAIVVSRNEDLMNYATGVDGSVKLSKHPDRTGTITISAQMGGSTHQFLSGIIAGQDIAETMLIGDMIINDPSGDATVYARGATLMTAPELEYGKSVEGATRDYVFFVTDLKFVGDPTGASEEVDPAIASAVSTAFSF